jgi:hypothetical protein
MQKRLRFLSAGNKKNKVIFTLAVIALIFILLLSILHSGKTQLTTSADASTTGNAAGSASLPRTTPSGATSSGSHNTQLSTNSSANITVDFGSRQNYAHPIPSQFLGIGGIDMAIAIQNNGGKYVPQAGFHFTKLGDYDYMSEIFPSSASMTNFSQQNWAHFDNQLTLAIQYNLQPMVTQAYTQLAATAEPEP